MAKLGSSASTPAKSEENKAPEAGSSTSSPSSSKPQTPQPDASRPKINITPAATPSTSSNPFNKLGVKNGSQTEPSSSTGSFRVRRKRPRSEIDDDLPAAPPASRPPPQTESDEDYADRVLQQLFRITVDPHEVVNKQGQRLTFLPDLNEELNSNGQPLKLSVASLDQAIMEACYLFPHEKPLMRYLLPCWKRVVRHVNVSKATEGPRFDLIKEAKRLCISACLFSLALPALYGYVFVA